MPWVLRIWLVSMKVYAVSGPAPLPMVICMTGMALSATHGLELMASLASEVSKLSFAASPTSPQPASGMPPVSDRISVPPAGTTWLGRPLQGV